MPITDVMIDLETLGTRVEDGVPILSIGWCCFDVLNEWPDAQHVQAAQMFVKRSPGTINIDTVGWWSKQSDGFRKILAECESGALLGTALNQLGAMFRSLGCPRVWSHGSMFDVAILEYWYRKLDLPLPWKYWQVMDTRTIYAACGVKLTGNTHDAMQDAIHQAALVHTCWRSINPGKES